MCFTIAIETTREYLEKRFNRRLVDYEKFQPFKVVKAFTFPKVPIICFDTPNQIEMGIWGLIPHWVKDVSRANEIRKRTFNARAETINEKPSYKNIYQKQHCLILTTGYYEWHTDNNKKKPYFIHLKSNEPFALAGLFDYWTIPNTGEQIKTFTIITTKANEMLEKIHNTQKRMPVILSENDENSWIDLRGKKDFHQLLRPFDEHLLEANVINEKI